MVAHVPTVAHVQERKGKLPHEDSTPWAKELESTTDQPFLAKKDGAFYIMLTLQGRYALSAFVVLLAVWSMWLAARTKPGHISCESVLLSRLLRGFGIQILTTDNVAGPSVAGLGIWL